VHRGPRIALVLGAALGPLWAACTPAQRAAEPGASPSSPPPAPSSSAAVAAPATSASSDAIFEPPADTHEEDATLPAGTVAVTLLDADGKPRPNEMAFLAQISETPAPDVTGHTDAGGRVTLSAPGWIGTSARIVAVSGGGSFYTSPFPIRARGGVRATLHGYDCSSDIKVAKVVFSVIVLVQLGAGDIEVAESFDAFVLGRVAWTPPDVVLPMPGGFSRFESANHSESSWDIFARQDVAVMRGTIPPGRQNVQTSFHVPLQDGGALVRVPVPPHTALSRVITWAGPATRLTAEGFPPARTERTSDSVALVTDRKLRPDDRPMTDIVVDVRGPIVAPKR
jgi:hypothetical protein